MNILIVDDDKVVLKSCQRILEASGYSIDLSCTAESAIRSIKTKKYDLLLVDVFMPKYNGTYLIAVVKESWPDLPILVMSGYPTAETIRSTEKQGADHFIAKPFTPEELIEAVKKILLIKD